jgi:aspartyl-tRNA(Asn)/glutamyl-tRNA(Gln) amidotransferase subunit B
MVGAKRSDRGVDCEVVIGLEAHAQLKTASKIFCGCSATYGAEPNTHACPICLGLPGILPVLNKKAVEYAFMMALAIYIVIFPLEAVLRERTTSTQTFQRDIRYPKMSFP